jgi:hypothetical protein
MDFSFLSSNRFWALVLIFITMVLTSSKVITEDLSMALITLLGGFVTIRTIDRATETISQ